MLLSAFFCNVIFMIVFLADRVSIGSKDNSDNRKAVLDSIANPVQRKSIAEKVVRKLVCDYLYYPSSYDPVETKVDSAFYGYLLDYDCINAAVELMDLRESYESAKETYENCDWTIRFHGNPSGPFLEHERKQRAESAKEMKELKEKISNAESIIKNRNTSKDGTFAGWVITHRYRAANSNNEVSFGNVLYVLDQQMTDKYLVRYSLEDSDSKNINAISKVIKDLLYENNE